MTSAPWCPWGPSRAPGLQQQGAWSIGLSSGKGGGRPWEPSPRTFCEPLPGTRIVSLLLGKRCSENLAPVERTLSRPSQAPLLRPVHTSQVGLKHQRLTLAALEALGEVGGPCPSTGSGGPCLLHLLGPAPLAGDGIQAPPRVHRPPLHLGLHPLLLEEPSPCFSSNMAEAPPGRELHPS